MIGTIHVVDLEIRCIVGILERERVNEQTIYLDLEFDHDFAAAAASEDVRHTVDYAEVSEVLADWVREQKFWLIETLAERACVLMFERWPAISRVKITVKKPDAVPATRHVGVSVERRRGES